MNVAVKFLLSRYGGKVITKEELKKVCERFEVDIDYLIHHLISYGYVIRILRGLYYVKTVEEFKLKKALRPLGNHRARIEQAGRKMVLRPVHSTQTKRPHP